MSNTLQNKQQEGKGSLVEIKPEDRTAISESIRSGGYMLCSSCDERETCELRNMYKDSSGNSRCAKEYVLQTSIVGAIVDEYDPQSFRAMLATDDVCVARTLMQRAKTSLDNKGLFLVQKKWSPDGSEYEEIEVPNKAADVWMQQKKTYESSMDLIEKEHVKSKKTTVKNGKIIKVEDTSMTETDIYDMIMQ